METPKTEPLSRRLIDGFANIFFPQHCIFCKRAVEPQYLSVCDRCARELPDQPPVRKGEFFSKCVSALPYVEPVRTSILRMKLGGRQGFLETYGRMIAARIVQEPAPRFDVITWVPISAARRAKRGFDQDRMLAEAMAEALDMPLLQTLKKVKNNPSQASLPTAAERRKNVLNVYRPVHPERYAGKQILLVDDVITTGSTLSECSRVLLTAGAADVVCATFAATIIEQ